MGLRSIRNPDRTRRKTLRLKSLDIHDFDVWEQRTPRAPVPWAQSSNSALRTVSNKSSKPASSRFSWAPCQSVSHAASLRLMSFPATPVPPVGVCYWLRCMEARWGSLMMPRGVSGPCGISGPRWVSGDVADQSDPEGVARQVGERNLHGPPLSRRLFKNVYLGPVIGRWAGLRQGWRVSSFGPCLNSSICEIPRGGADSSPLMKSALDASGLV